MHLDTAAILSSLENHKPPATKPVSKLSPSTLLTYRSMEIKDPHQLYTLAKSFHQDAGYKLSELSYTSKRNAFTVVEMKDNVRYETFIWGGRKLLVLVEASSLVYTMTNAFARLT